MRALYVPFNGFYGALIPSFPIKNQPEKTMTRKSEEASLYSFQVYPETLNPKANTASRYIPEIRGYWALGVVRVLKNKV